MRNLGSKSIVCNSSATIYGIPIEIPITENCPKGVCSNSYCVAKSILEQVLIDVQRLIMSGMS